jgi:molybdenum-dependent DNA-binding transcriptional regulator ModE
MDYNIEPKVEIKINGEIYSYKLFESLKLLDETKSQRAAAKRLKISHSVLNRRIKNATNKLGFNLVKISGSRTYLTEESKKLVNIYEKYNLKIKETERLSIVGGHIVTNFLESISDDIPFEIDIYSSNDPSSYELAKRGLVDILALDDPKLAFENNLDFIPIGYDHLVLVSNDLISCNDIENIHDLKNLEFISVDGTAQRLAWNTLNENNIPYKIIKKVKSEFDAFKIVKNSDKLYTFLNASYFKGNEVLKEETKHVVSLIPMNKDKKEVNKFVEYLSNEGQKLVSREGFVPIKPWKIKISTSKK